MARTLPSGVQLPRAIAIDEYKADTDAGKYQLIIADAETHAPIDILPNRRKETIKQYLQENGENVEIVIVDMNTSFKAAVKKALDRPIIVDDRFDYCPIFTGRWMESVEKCRKNGIHTIVKKQKECERGKEYFCRESRFRSVLL